MEEKRFPIYRFWANWTQDNIDYKNGFSARVMYKEHQSDAELRVILEKMISGALEKDSVKGQNPKMVDSGFEFIEEESWCLRWFNHYTFNHFDTDEEAERSFNQFIYRKESQNLENGHYKHESSDSKKPFHCFMGAEDRWRWDSKPRR